MISQLHNTSLRQTHVPAITTTQNCRTIAPTEPASQAFHGLVQMLKKILKIVGVVMLVAVVAEIAWLEYSTVKNNAVPGELALAALISDSEVTVEDGDWLVMKPANGTPSTGLIIYPGANCNIRGYAPLMREIAAAGFLVVAMSMPYDFTIFAPGSATEVPPVYPEIKDWFLAGHSMGGAMAGTFAASNADMLSGLICGIPIRHLRSLTRH
jgi:hypothetical protein